MIGDGVLGARYAHGEIAIGLEVAVLIGALEFDALAEASRPIELGQHDRLTELAVVDQIVGDLGIGVQAHHKARQQFLIDADIEIMRAFRRHRIVERHRRLVGRVVEQREIGGGRLRLHRRREIARIARVNAGPFDWRVNDAKELIKLVEAQAGVEDELVGDLPFMLNVAANIPAGFRIEVRDREGRRRDGAGDGIDRQNSGRVGDVGPFGGDREAGAQLMGVVNPVGAIELRSIEIAFARHIRGHVVEHQIAEDIGNEMDAGVTLKHGELRVEIVDLRLQGEHVVDVCVDFVFVERRGRINSGAKIAERRLTRIVRDLKFARGGAGNKAQARRIA